MFVPFRMVDAASGVPFYLLEDLPGRVGGACLDGGISCNQAQPQSLPEAAPQLPADSDNFAGPSNAAGASQQTVLPEAGPREPAEPGPSPVDSPEVDLTAGSEEELLNLFADEDMGADEGALAGGEGALAEGALAEGAFAEGAFARDVSCEPPGSQKDGSGCSEALALTYGAAEAGRPPSRAELASSSSDATTEGDRAAAAGDRSGGDGFGTAAGESHATQSRLDAQPGVSTRPAVAAVIRGIGSPAPGAVSLTAVAVGLTRIHPFPEAIDLVDSPMAAGPLPWVDAPEPFSRLGSHDQEEGLEKLAALYSPDPLSLVCSEVLPPDFMPAGVPAVQAEAPVAAPGAGQMHAPVQAETRGKRERVPTERQPLGCEQPAAGVGLEFARAPEAEAAEMYMGDGEGLDEPGSVPAREPTPAETDLGGGGWPEGADPAEPVDLEAEPGDESEPALAEDREAVPRGSRASPTPVVDSPANSGERGSSAEPDTCEPMSVERASPTPPQSEAEEMEESSPERSSPGRCAPGRGVLARNARARGALSRRVASPEGPVAAGLAEDGAEATRRSKRRVKENRRSRDIGGSPPTTAKDPRSAARDPPLAAREHRSAARNPRPAPRDPPLTAQRHRSGGQNPRPAARDPHRPPTGRHASASEAMYVDVGLAATPVRPSGPVGGEASPKSPGGGAGLLVGGLLKVSPEDSVRRCGAPPYQRSSRKIRIVLERKSAEKRRLEMPDPPTSRKKRALPKEEEHATPPVVSTLSFDDGLL